MTESTRLHHFPVVTRGLSLYTAQHQAPGPLHSLYNGVYNGNYKVLFALIPYKPVRHSQYQRNSSSFCIDTRN